MNSWKTSKERGEGGGCGTPQESMEITPGVTTGVTPAVTPGVTTRGESPGGDPRGFLSVFVAA